ncbi:MAG: dihydrofolate reductase [Euryarchaeota archaeon]|jgi:dihydrofolate reductase|nr:dihydrofolate reductase [Euryarchaeota archaeon]MBT4925025.1 dihydrofolate reductase [Euryarchaeota archaeon]MBT5735307.1 dihydrofolate reductase [Euryarchaeota archaeon]MBT7460508.1 dihydrofolate reductase [Euryarchaeota archaeon]
MIIFVYACDLKGAIGKDGDLPWKQSTDLQHFKRVTLGGTIVMGRKTWESLPGKLPGRRSIVMSRSQRDDVEVMSYDEVRLLSQEQDVYIIGGGEIYRLFIDDVKELHRTIIQTEVEDADTFAPDIHELGFHLIGERIVEAGDKDQYNMVFQHFIR